MPPAAATLGERSFRSPVGRRSQSSRPGRVCTSPRTRRLQDPAASRSDQVFGSRALKVCSAHPDMPQVPRVTMRSTHARARLRTCQHLRTRRRPLVQLAKQTGLTHVRNCIRRGAVGSGPGALGESTCPRAGHRPLPGWSQKPKGRGRCVGRGLRTGRKASEQNE